MSGDSFNLLYPTFFVVTIIGTAVFPDIEAEIMAYPVLVVTWLSVCIFVDVFKKIEERRKRRQDS